MLEGLLDVTPRLGYTVVGISQQDVDDIFQLRVITEVAAAQLALDRITPEALERLEALSVSGYDPADAESLQQYAVVNAEFHDIIGTMSGNRRLAELITRLMLESRRFVQIAQLTAEHGREVAAQHRAIAEAFRSGNRDAVGEAVRLHVEDSWHSYWKVSQPSPDRARCPAGGADPPGPATGTLPVINLVSGSGPGSVRREAPPVLAGDCAIPFCREFA